MRIRQERIPTLVTVLSLTLLALTPASYGEVVEADIPSGDLGEDGQSSTLVMSVPADRPVCHAFYDAEAIYQSLQPSPTAHLDRKITAFAGSTPGWGEGLGLGHEVSTSCFLPYCIVIKC